MTKSNDDEVKENTTQEDLSITEETTNELLSKVQHILQQFENNKKLAKLIKDFDKTAKDFSLQELLTNNLLMIELVDKAKKDRDEYLATLQRFKADFDNYKKRAEKQANYNIQLSSERILSKIFEPIEDLNRALDFAKEKNQEIIPLDGIEIIYNKLSRVLKDEGISEINPKQGEAFDPKYQEAICLDNSGKFDSEIVVQVFEKGYKLKEKVLRPAKVMVSAEAPEEEASNEAKNEIEQTEEKEN
ncbi:MAG: nucleotide exchange factor GrpE [Asgard group archaeon]|nr:nucleotide exchange factor GrpE [Asgard group archaeon]